MKKSTTNLFFEKSPLMQEPEDYTIMCSYCRLCYISDKDLRHLGAVFDQNNQFWYWKSFKDDSYVVTDNTLAISKVNNIINLAAECSGIQKNGTRLDLHCFKSELDDSIKKLSKFQENLIEKVSRIIENYDIDIS